MFAIFQCVGGWGYALVNKCTQTNTCLTQEQAWLQERGQGSPKPWEPVSQQQPLCSPQSQQRPMGPGARDSGGVSTPTLQLGHLVPWFDKQLQQKEPLDLSDPCLFPYGPALSHSNPQLLPPPCPRETHCETVPPHWCFKTRGLVHPHTPHLPATCSYCVHWIE